jgi:predicted dehydrogenase
MAALRFGVAGTAYWAREIHLPGLLAADGARVCGVWGRTPATVATIAAAHGVTAFPTFDDMLAEVDAVTIAVPPEAQGDLAIRAARAGKHLILEKPVARDSQTAHGIAAAVAEAGVASLVFFLRRFQPDIAAAIEAAQGHGWDKAAIRVHSAALVTASPYAASVWRQDEGAALWDIGPHALSVLIPLLGDVVSVEGAEENGGISRFRTHHDGGATAEISVTLRSAPGQVSNWYRFQSPTRDIVLPDPVFDRVAVFSRAARRLIEMVAAGRMQDACDVGLGVRTVDILGCVEASARLGSQVIIPPSGG